MAATDTSEILGVGQIVGGRYQVKAKLGEGGMGALYVVRHLRIGREFALKALHPGLRTRRDLIQRFAAEARAAGAIQHPGIVAVTDFDEDDGVPFLVMEKLEGEDLAARIERAGGLPVPFVVRVGIEIADAIAAAHAQKPKIIHRDLKPQNVFLAREGKRQDVVKVLDFGIAKLVATDALSGGLTLTGDVCGTPLYMSPEQLRSAKDVDERTDVYSIGVILFEALAGKPPFSGDSFAELVLKIAKDEPDLRLARPDVPAQLVAIIDKAMARERGARFATVGEMRDALFALAPGLQLAASEPPPPPPGWMGRRVVVISLSLAAAGLTTFFWWRARQPPSAAPDPPSLPTGASVAPASPPPGGEPMPPPKETTMIGGAPTPAPSSPARKRPGNPKLVPPPILEER